MCWGWGDEGVRGRAGYTLGGRYWEWGGWGWALDSTGEDVYAEGRRGSNSVREACGDGWLL